MLTVKQMGEIMVDIGAERPIRVTGPEARKFAEQVKIEMDEIRAKGQVVELPFDPEFDG